MQPYIHKVQFYETDLMGVVHHSNYLRWFEEARLDCLERAGLTYNKLADSGFAGATLAVSCEYRRSVCFGQTVEIEAVLKDCDDRFMTIGYIVRDSKSKKELATGETKHCFIGIDGKMVSLKEKDPQKYESLLSMLNK